MQEKNPGDEAEPLAVADVVVEERVGLEQVEERELAGPEGRAEVRVVGEGAAEVDEDGVLLGGELLQQQLVRRVVVGEVAGVQGRLFHAELLGEELPDLAALASWHACDQSFFFVYSFVVDR